MRPKYIIAVILLTLLVARHLKAQDNFGYSGIIVGSGPPPLPAGPLSVVISCSPTAGPATLTANCTSTPTGGTPPYTYQWVWGDGTAQSTTQNPMHSFTRTGTFAVNVIVTDSIAATAANNKLVFATGAAYYVTKAGSDSNAGTAMLPFLTLGKCQTAMQSGNKVCIVNDSGTYTDILTFTSADAGEVWLVGAGQSPVIDGSSTNVISANGATGLTMRGFIFQHLAAATLNGNGTPSQGSVLLIGSNYDFRWNTFLNCPKSCIRSQAAIASATFDSNTFNNGTPTTPVITGSYNLAAMGLDFGSNNITITHNHCENLNGDCAEFNTGSAGQSNNVLEYNLMENVRQGVVDAGSLYMFDDSACGGTLPCATPTTATGNRFRFNVDFTTTNPAFASTCYYLDAAMANMDVEQNICVSYKAGTAGGNQSFSNPNGNYPGEFTSFPQYNKNTWKNNIFEVGASPGYGDFYDCGGSATTYPFSGCSLNENGTYVGSYPYNGTASLGPDTFANNIVFTRGAWDKDGLWTLISANPSTTPTRTGNTYFSQTGAAFPPSTWNSSTWVYRNGGTASFKDASFSTTNPTFASPSTNNYAMTNPPAGWTALPTDQGALNSPFVSAGTAGCH